MVKSDSLRTAELWYKISLEPGKRPAFCSGGIQNMSLKIIRQDITRMAVDAIVNSTNPDLTGYSGADYAIHQAAGPELDEYCRKLAPVKNGQIIVTEGYNLKCSHIIHVCGPVWNGGNEQETRQLEGCYLSCLKTAAELKCLSVALPLISAGNRGFPGKSALDIAISSITEFLSDYEMNVYLCVYDTSSFRLSQKLVSSVLSYIDDNYVRENDYDICYNCEPEILPDKSATRPGKFRRKASRAPEPDAVCEARADAFGAPSFSGSLEKAILNMDASFSETLLRLIDEKGMTDVECYKKAYVNRKTFSKIRCNKYYRPSKETVIAFALSLELNLDETNALLNTAGFTLSHCFKYDIIIEYFIKKSNYNISEINEVLYSFDLPCFGCTA